MPPSYLSEALLLLADELGEGASVSVLHLYIHHVQVHVVIVVPNDVPEITSIKIIHYIITPINF